MNSIFSTILSRFNSVTFLRTFAMILAAELVTMCVAWFLIERSPSTWVKEQVDYLNRVSVAVESARNDWALVAAVPKEHKSPLFPRYQDTLKALEHKYFPHRNGDLYLGIIMGTQEYTITSSDADLWDVTFKPDVWELESISSGQTSYTNTPHTDDTGTYLASSTPVFRNGKVVAVVVAEGDALQLGDLQGLVTQAFWLSIPPAILISLIVASGLASMFVRPIEVLRSIAEPWSAEDEDRWGRMTAREKELANWLRQGTHSDKDLAKEMGLKPSTVADYVKQISRKTNWSRFQVGLAAQRRRSAATP